MYKKTSELLNIQTDRNTFQGRQTDNLIDRHKWNNQDTNRQR